MIQGDLWGENINDPASNLGNLEDPQSTERPLDADEIILGSDGNPINSKEAWDIALQKGDSRGNVVGPDGQAIRRPKALRMAMDKDYEVLAAQLDAGFTENTARFLDFYARVHKYSPGNTDLIFMQAPYATYVQGHSAWTRGGYKVKTKEQGGKPIYILQPHPYMKITTRDEEGNIVEVQTPAVYFTIALVYDVTSIDQTKKKVPDFFTPLAGNADILIARFVEVLAEDGILVEWRYPDIATQGASYGGLIEVRPDLPSINKFLVLAHEGAHEWLHKEEDRLKLPKSVKECQAEVVAYMLASHFGIRSPLSADYLKMYGNDKEILKANLNITKPLVHGIIDRMEEPYDLHAVFEYNPEQEGERKQYTPRVKRNKGRSKRK
jgi:hypothetical protein